MYAKTARHGGKPTSLLSMQRPRPLAALPFCAVYLFAAQTPAIAQLMIEVIKQQEARDKAEAARAKAAAAAAAAEAARGDDNSSKAKLECSKASKMAPNLDPAEVGG